MVNELVYVPIFGFYFCKKTRLVDHKQSDDFSIYVKNGFTFVKPFKVVILIN